MVTDVRPVHINGPHPAPKTTDPLIEALLLFAWPEAWSDEYGGSVLTERGLRVATEKWGHEMTAPRQVAIEALRSAGLSAYQIGGSAGIVLCAITTEAAERIEREHH